VSYWPGVLLPEYVMCVKVMFQRGLESVAAASAQAFACAVVMFAYMPCLYRLNQAAPVGKVST
jgi:hypothetical protein